YAAAPVALLGAATPCSGLTAGFLGVGTGTITGSEVCGHPADKVGWAVGGGSRHNFPGGDYFQWQGTYTPSAPRYMAFAPAGAFSPVQFNGDNLGYGFFSDGIFSNATGEIQLTTVWGFNAAYDHLWLPNFRSSLYASYLRVDYGSNANLAICNAQTTAPSAVAPSASSPPRARSRVRSRSPRNRWPTGHATTTSTSGRSVPGPSTTSHRGSMWASM